MSYVLNSGSKIPHIGFGVYLAPPGEVARIVETALKFGYRHIDTASFYGNEKEAADGIANFLKANPSISRSEVFYTTKIWMDDFGYEKAKEAIKKSLEAASSIGYIDLFLLHVPQGPPELRLGSYKALQEAVGERTVKNIGVSNYGVHHLRELLSWSGLKITPAVNQIEINPWFQRDEIIHFCKTNGILIEAYSPLMRGQRLNDPELVVLAKKYDKTVAQILVKWHLQQGYLPLPKSATELRIKSNIQVDDFQLSKEDITNLGSKSDNFVTLKGWDPTTWD